MTSFSLSRDGFSLSRKDEAILRVLRRNEQYGLGLQEAIEGASDFQLSMSCGSLYPNLRRLEKSKLISSRQEEARLPQRKGNRRVYYRITERGESILNELDLFRARLDNWPNPIY